MPRTLPTARVKMRTLAAADVIAHWRMEETSGATIADAAGLSDLTMAAPAVVTGTFFGEANNKGRGWNGTTSATGASTAGQRDRLQGSWVAEIWVKVTATPAGTRHLIVHTDQSGGADGVEANNTLLQIGVTASLAVEVAWEFSTGGDVTATSPAGVLVVDALHHLAVRKRLTPGGFTLVQVFVDGVRVSQTGSLTSASGGSNGSWRMASQVGATFFVGEIYEVRISEFNAFSGVDPTDEEGAFLSDEGIRDSAARGHRDWSLARVIASQEYSTHTRVLVRDIEGGWDDFTDLYDATFVDGAEDSDGVDDDGASGKVTMRRRNNLLSLAPMMTSSRPNLESDDGTLLDVARRIRIEEAVLPHGASRALAAVNWEQVFDGFIASVEFAGAVISLGVADKMKAFHTAWVQPNRGPTPPTDLVYDAAGTGTALETVLQDLIIDNTPPEEYLGTICTNVYVPVSPAFNLEGPWTVPPSKSVAQAITDLVDTTIGWLFRFRWDESRQEFRATLYEPGRARTWSSTDPTITPSQVLAFKRLELNDADIRNDIEVEYGLASATDNTNTITRETVRAENAASIARWGRRYARVGLESTSEINDATQAQALADLILSDLSSPVADFEVELRPRRDILVGDQVKFTPDGLRFDGNQTVAVVGVAHARGRDNRRTTLSCRCAVPVGRRLRWHEVITVVGVVGGKGWSPPVTPLAPALVAIAGGLQVSWALPVNRGNRRYRETEVHISATTGFTPSPSTLAGLVRGKNTASLELDGYTDYFVKILHRDDMNNASAASPQATAMPRYTPKTPHLHARLSGNQTIAKTSPDTIVFNTVEAGTDPFGNYDDTTGIWQQSRDALVHVDASAIYDSDLKAGAAARLVILVGGGVRKIGPTVVVDGSFQAIVSVSGVLWLADGDTVEISIQHGGGDPLSAVVASTDSTWLSVVMGAHI